MFSSNTSAVSGDAVYIEDVFSTWLYTGNGSTQTITNGIDLSGKGGLVWMKGRNNTTDRSHNLVDTARGSNKSLFTNLTNAEATATDRITSFNSDGFGLGSSFVTNENTFNYVSWTFRKQPKFFDVVTWTGDGVVGRNIPHNLVSTPGCIIVKNTSSSSSWPVYHRSRSTTQETIFLNLTGGFSNDNAFGDPTSTNIVVGGNPNYINENGRTYVAYLFAHNAGGFGLTGTDNVISCGSFTGSSSTVSITLGWEPQWLLVKCSGSSGGNWILMDNMRGLGVNGGPYVYPNQSAAEYGAFTPSWSVNATGFTVAPSVDINRPSEQSIYIAIRRGPMKTPTSGTSVFTPIARTGTGSATTISGVGFAADLLWDGVRNTAGYGNFLLDKLRGGSQRLGAYTTAAEVTETTAPVTQFGNTSVNISSSGTVNDSGVTYVNWMFRRAPGFFDEVCWQGQGSDYTQAHNLGVVPELVIARRRNNPDDWSVSSNFGSTTYNNKYLNTNSSGGGIGVAYTANWSWLSGAPTASVLNLRSTNPVNTFVAYLFASVPGVSKVGYYTGTGAAQTINCGFTGGARFVLITRMDSTGDWFVWDTARGITSGNDPYLLLNTTGAEVTTTDYISAQPSGFGLTSSAPIALNANGGTYLFLAIA